MFGKVRSHRALLTLHSVVTPIMLLLLVRLKGSILTCLRFDSDVIVHRLHQSLSQTEVSFGGFYGPVAE